MWLVMSVIMALIATLCWINNPNSKKNYGWLSLGFWGLSVMILVDHVLGWIGEGSEGPFFEISDEAFILSLIMISAVVAIWELYLSIKVLKNRE